MTIQQFMNDFWLPVSIVLAIPIVIAISIWQQLSDCRSDLTDAYEHEQNTLYTRIIK